MEDSTLRRVKIQDLRSVVVNPLCMVVYVVRLPLHVGTKRKSCLYYCATQPPSTAIGRPVTKDAASEHSHTTASPTSSGAAMRPMGSTATNCSSEPGLARTARSSIGVRI